MKQLTLLFMLCLIIGCTSVPKGDADQSTTDTTTFTIPKKYTGKLDSMLMDSCDAIILERLIDMDPFEKDSNRDAVYNKFIQELPPVKGATSISMVHVREIILNKTHYAIPDTLCLAFSLDERTINIDYPSDMDSILYLTAFKGEEGHTLWTYLFDNTKYHYSTVPVILFGEEYEEHKREEEAKKQKRDRDLYHPFTPPPPILK